MKQLAFAILLILFALGAYGKCAPMSASEAELVRSANAIFVAKIVSAYAKEHKNSVTLVYGKYRLINVIKGTPLKSGTVESSLSDVGIPFTPGFVYLFFTYGSPNVDWCGGSRILKNFYMPYPNDDKRMLEHIKKLVANH